MKRLLLSCDNYIFCFRDNYYVPKGHNSFYNRYLRVFDELRIVCRTKKLKESPPEGLEKLENNKIDVWAFPFFQGPLQFAKVYFKGKISLKDVTKDCSAAILRLPSTTAFQVQRQVLKHKLPFSIEIVFDSFDAYIAAGNPIIKFLMKQWHNETLKACKYAEGVSCVTSNYMQQHYRPLKTDAFISNYSSLSLENKFYTANRSYPLKNIIEIAHISNQIDFKGRKGHCELIQALAIIINKGFGVHINFIGANYFGGIEKLEQLAKSLGVRDYVRFTGFLFSQYDIFENLKKADLFVLPTKAEGLPRVLIEAMAVGLPCITTNVSGNSELIQHKFLINDFYDINELANQIIELISNHQLYEDASRYNFEKSLQYESTVLQTRRDDFYTKLKLRSL